MSANTVQPTGRRTDRGFPQTSPAGDLLGAVQAGLGPGSSVDDLVGGLDVAELVGVVDQAEQLIAWLRYVQLAATGEAVAHVTENNGLEPFEVYGTEAVAKHRDLVRSVVAEELALKTGVPQYDAQARVEFVTAAPEGTRRLCDAMCAGEVSWERARRIRERTAEHPAVVADEVARRCLVPARHGEPVTWRLFTRRLRDAVNAVTDSEARRKAARSNRDTRVWLSEEGDGSGTFQITGEGERVVAAAERIDATARSLRRDGDPRSLAQLRSDIALDLLMHGQMPDGSVCAGSLPPARLSVTVSLATLVGAANVSGEHRYGTVAASVVRRLACHEGTTLARIVTDPLTGAAVDATTDSCRPTAAMRRFVEARDRSCRAPGCDAPAERCDLDHSVSWPHGSTTPTNLAAAHRRHHEYKTRGWWCARQHSNGTVTWSTLGGSYTSYPHDYDIELLAEIDQLATAERWLRIHLYRDHVDACRLGPTADHERCPESWAWSENGEPPSTRGLGVSEEHLDRAEAAARERAELHGLGDAARLEALRRRSAVRARERREVAELAALIRGEDWGSVRHDWIPVVDP